MLKFFFLLALLPLTSSAVDLTETQAMGIYLNRNLSVMASRFNIELSKADELTVGLWANPSFFVDTQLNPFGGKNWNQKNAGGPAQQDYIFTVPIDVNGKRRQAVKVAKLATKVSEAEFQAYVRAGVYNMLSVLYTLQRLKRELELLQEKGQLLERLVLTLEKRIGSTNNQPLIQSRARLAFEDVKYEIQKNKIDYNDTLKELRLLLHIDNTEEINPLVTFRVAQDTKFDLQELVQNAKEKRPDFIALGILRNQLDNQLVLDERRIFSDVAIQAGFSRQNYVGARPGEPSSFSLPGAWSWMIGVSLPLPVFDRNQGNILQTKIRSNQTLLRERYMVETITNEIDASIKRIEIINLNLTRFKNGQLNNAKIVRDSALRQFGTGATTLLEYLDAVNAYHVSIQKYLSTQYDLTTEYLKLKLITGQEVSP